MKTKKEIYSDLPDKGEAKFVRSADNLILGLFASELDRGDELYLSS